MRNNNLVFRESSWHIFSSSMLKTNFWTSTT